MGARVSLLSSHSPSSHSWDLEPHEENGGEVGGKAGWVELKVEKQTKNIVRDWAGGEKSKVQNLGRIFTFDFAARY